jgi:hypothetical protein
LKADGDSKKPEQKTKKRAFAGGSEERPPQASCVLYLELGRGAEPVIADLAPVGGVLLLGLLFVVLFDHHVVILRQCSSRAGAHWMVGHRPLQSTLDEGLQEIHSTLNSGPENLVHAFGRLERSGLWPLLTDIIYH